MELISIDVHMPCVEETSGLARTVDPLAQETALGSIFGTHVSQCSDGPSDSTSQSFLMSLDKIDMLDSEFERTPDPSWQQIVRIGKETQLSLEEVHTWFHRKRSKRKRCFVEQQALMTPELTIDNSDSSYGPEEGSSFSPLQYRQTLPVDLSVDPVFELHDRISKKRKAQIPSEQRISDFVDDSDMVVVSETHTKPPNVKTYLHCPTSTCDRRATGRKGWMDHQERVHFPKSIYVCGAADGEEPCGATFWRKDNARNHMRNIHSFSTTRNANADDPLHSFPIDGMFHDRCGFGFCNAQFISREESMNHIFDHVEEGYGPTDWSHRCDVDHEQKLEEYRKEAVRSMKRSKKKSPDGSDEDDYRDDGSGTSGGSHNDPTSTNLGLGSNSCNSGQTSRKPSSDNANGRGRTSNSHRHSRRGSASDCDADSPGKGAKFILDALDEVSEKVTSVMPLTMIRKLGFGSFGNVREVFSKTFKTTFALKTIRHDSRRSSAFNSAIAKNEISIMSVLQHPHVVKLIGSHISRTYSQILMHPVADGNLAQFFEGDREFPLPGITERFMLRRSFSCLASATAYLHSMDIRHGDIKPSNVLIRDGAFYLADFGLSSFDSSDTRGPLKFNAGTTKYSPPEVLNVRGKQTCAAYDVWSLGCLFFEILTFYMRGKEGLEDLEIFRTADNEAKPYRSSTLANKMWIRMLRKEYDKASYDSSFRKIFDLIDTMLTVDICKRPSASEVRDSLPKYPCCSYSCSSLPHGELTQGGGTGQDENFQHPLAKDFNAVSSIHTFPPKKGLLRRYFERRSQKGFHAHAEMEFNPCAGKYGKDSAGTVADEEPGYHQLWNPGAACETGFPALVEKLLFAGAGSESPEMKLNGTSLQIACEIDNLASARILSLVNLIVDKGLDSYQQSSLEAACEAEVSTLVERFLLGGPYSDSAVASRDSTALHLAYNQTGLTSARPLLAARSAVDKGPDSHQLWSSEAASEIELLKPVEMLLFAGANSELRSELRNTTDLDFAWNQSTPSLRSLAMSIVARLVV